MKKMKKYVLSALLLAGALVVAPLGNIFSMVATASSNNYAYDACRLINRYFPRISSGDMTTAEALQQISALSAKHEWDIEEFMAAEPFIAAQFKQLEMMYAEENAANPIQVSAVVASDVQDKLSSASVERAELNAAAGSTVTLSVEAPAQQVDLGDRKSVQLEISLTGVADSHNLSFPVRVTVSVPAGLDAGNMHILHYVNGISAAPENVPFTVNGDGTITFSTTSFSLFAFVEGEYVAPDNNDANEDADAEEDTEDEAEAEEEEEDDSAEQSAEAVSAQGVKDSVPKTGDSTVPVLPFAAAGAACAAAACILKKKGQA